MVITSFDNDKVKYLKKLSKKKYRDLYNEFLVEGRHLVIEAYKHNMLKEIILCEGEVTPFDVPYTVVSYEVMKKISEVETPQKIMGICKKLDDTTIGSRILLLDEIQDPGNMGTIIRSAVAFDIDTIILSKNCVDLYNPKVVRSTQGMLFHIPILIYDFDELLPMLKELKIPIYATRVEYGTDVSTLKEDEKKRFALLMGNEGNGVHPEYLELSDKNLYIPMSNEVESLNVAIATSILLYELRNKDE
jgi:23S rRNA methyltransferase